MVGKTEGQRHFGRPKYRQENNTETDLKGRGWVRVEWNDLAQYKCRWWAIVNTVMYRFHKMRGISRSAEEFQLSEEESAAWTHLFNFLLTPVSPSYNQVKGVI